MNASELINHLASLGVKIHIEEDELRIQAPKGVINKSTQQQLSDNKPEIMRLLKPVTSESKIVKVDRSEPILVSAVQERFIFNAKINPDDISNNIPNLHKLAGSLNQQAFKEALYWLALQHEALRTIYSENDDLTQQVVLPEPNHEFEFIDLSDKPSALESAYDIAYEDSNRLFDLFAGPLLRIKLIKCADDVHLFSWTIHHSISDGWSSMIFLRDLKRYYETLVSKMDVSVDDGILQYADYSAWEAKQMDSHLFQQQLSYWKQRFSSSVPTLALPTDLPRPVVKTYQGRSIPFDLPEELKKRLEALVRDSSVTMFTLLLSAFKVLLYQYTQQNEICVGIPIARRYKPEVENIYGCFINTLAIRSDIDEHQPFLDYLKTISETCLEAFSNQDVPIERVIEEVKPERSTSFTPLFQSLFVFHVQDAKKINTLGEVEISRVDLHSNSAKFDVTLSVVDTGSTINAYIEYSSDLFLPETIQRMSEHYIQLLEGITENPNRSISEIPLITDLERSKCLNEWNTESSSPVPNVCVHEHFEKQVSLIPDAVAVSDLKTSLTYHELNQAANRLAQELVNQGISTESKIGLYLDRSAEVVVAILAVHKAGAAYVPLEPEMPADRIDYIATDSAVELFLINRDLIKANNWVPSPKVAQLVVADFILANEGTEDVGDLKQKVGFTDLAYVLYTSGSTGNPKGVMVEHGQLANYVCGVVNKCEFTSGMKYAMLQPVSVDSSVTMLQSSLTTGGSLHIIDKDTSLDSVALESYFTKFKIDCLKIAPSHLNALLPAKVLPAKKLIIGGEASKWNLIDKIVSQSSCDIYNHYGPTETTVGVLINQVNAEGQLSQSLTVPIGRPLPNTFSYVLDGNMQPVPVGVQGELYIGGPYVARGYLNLPEITELHFLPNPFVSGDRLYKTGDRARYLDNGDIEYLGRVDSQIKIRGYRLEPGEIEKVLLDNTSVKDVAVTATTDPDGENQLIAYVVTDDATNDAVLTQLRKELEDKLPVYMIPTGWVNLESLPRSIHGKVKFSELPAPKAIELTVENYAEPQTEIEINLAKIWADVLEVPQVGLHDDFFKLGGHSLKAINLVSTIKKQLGVRVPLISIFQGITISDLVNGSLFSQLTDSASNSLPGGDTSDRVLDSEPEIVSVDRSGPVLASAVQERFIFNAKINPGDISANIPKLHKLTGSLDQHAFKEALYWLALQHEALRTIYAENGDLIHQVILPEPNHEFELFDLSNKPNAFESAYDIAYEDSNRLFDLFAGPLLRIKLIKCSDDVHLFSWTIHHSISDGWSTMIFLRDLKHYYERLISKLDVSVDENNLQYADYSAWEAKQMDSPLFQQQLSYWKQRFSSSVPALALPTDLPRPIVKSNQGDAITFDLSEDLKERLEVVVRDSSVTLFTLLLSAFKVLLFQYSRQNELCVGTPIARRNKSESDNIYGCFINTLAIRSDIDEHQPFLDYLKTVWESCSEAFSNQDIPIERVIEEVKPERSTSFTPLFQSLFVLHVQHVHDPKKINAIGGVEITPEDLHSNSAKFDLTLNVFDTDSTINAFLEYSTDLFLPETIQRMSEHYLQLLEGIAENPNRKISEIPLITDLERSKCLNEWNSGTSILVPNLCVHEHFEKQVSLTPDAAAVSDLKTSLTYYELNQAANRLAQELVSQGISTESKVGLYLERSVEVVIGILAVHKAGAAYVPLEPEMPADRIDYIAEDATVELLLVNKGLINANNWEPSAAVKQLVVSDYIGTSSAGENVDNLNINIEFTDLAYVLYTSGSTGNPKGVMVEHGQLSNYVCGVVDYCKFTSGMNYAMVQPVSVDSSVTMLQSSLTTGGSLHVIDKETSLDSVALESYFAKFKIDCLKIAPSHLNALLPAKVLPAKKLIIGGEASKWSLIEDIVSQSSCDIYNHYGPTETTVGVLINQVNNTGNQLKQGLTVPIGRPLPNTLSYVLDGNMQPVPIGVQGELYIGGPYVARGYLNLPEITEQSFLPNPFVSGDRLYKTGDRARYLDNGDIEYLGRADSQIKIRGFRLEPGEIEKALLDNKIVKDVAVTAIADPDGENQLVAYVVTHDVGLALFGAANASLSDAVLAQLRESLQEKLPAYMIPTGWVMLESLPRSIHGKVKFSELPATKAIELTVEDHTEPQSEIETKLAKIWADVLGVPQVGLHDDFFSLGGHSLKAIKLINKIENQLGVRVPLISIFQGATISDLANGALFSQLAESSTDSISADNTYSSVRDSDSDIVKVDRSVPILASAVQERFIFNAKINPNDTSNNISNLRKLTGSLDHHAFKEALYWLALQHEALRTIYAENGDLIQQVISPEPNHDFEFVDLSDKPNALDSAYDVAHEDSKLQIDLFAGPLLRVKLIKCSDDVHLFTWTIHHSISDGWSSMIFLRDLKHYYERLISKLDVSVDKNNLQYADYSVWEAKQMDSQWFQQQLSYWKQQFSSSVPTLALPTDMPRPIVKSSQGSSIVFDLPEDLKQRLDTIVRDSSVTLYTLLLSAFKVLLFQYTRQDEICVGTPVARRNRPESENIHGCFINTLAIRSDFDERQTFLEFLKTIRETCIEAFSNQDVPIERVIEEVKPERSTSFTPLFQSLFVFHVQDSNKISALGEVEITPVELHSSGAKFDLTLNIVDADSSSIKAFLVYSTDLFLPETIQRMSEHYLQLLEGIAENPNCKISEIPLITDLERSKCLTEWNSENSISVPNLCVHEHFEKQVTLTPDAAAVSDLKTSLTYHELNQAANRLAQELVNQGISTESKIGLYLERSVEVVVAILAVHKAGAAYVPLEPEMPADRIDYIAEDATVELLLVNKGLINANNWVASSKVTQLVVADFMLATEGGADVGNLNLKVEFTDLAYVLYTSGSTGNPKGVMVEHSQLSNYVSGVVDYCEFTPGMNYAMLQPVSVDSSVTMLQSSLTTGGSLHVIDKETALDSVALESYFAKFKIDCLKIAPSHLNALLPAKVLPAKKLIIGGEASKWSLIEDIVSQSSCDIYNHYGPTETTVGVLINQVNNSGGQIKRGLTVPIGRPLPNTLSYVLDSNMQPVPIGVQGELYIGGPYVARGYLNLPEITEKSFLPNPFVSGDRLYKTGDRARYLDNGDIEYLGRADSQIKIRGFRLEPGEIEKALLDNKIVKDVAVTAITDPKGENQLVAYVVTHDVSSDAVLTQLREALQDKLPAYMIPTGWVSLESLPRSIHGKVKFSELPAPKAIELTVENYTEPQSEIEIKLAKIWADVLDVQQVGLHDDFFNLGGHSLIAIKLVSNIEKQLGVRVPLISIFQGTTISDLANGALFNQSAESSTNSLSGGVTTCRVLNKNGNKTPFFMIGSHPKYAVAASYLPDDQPAYQLDTYAVQIQRSVNGDRPHASIDDFASEFYEQIKTIQPTGPYKIGGGCEGAHVAFELARRFKSEGEEVSLLVTWGSLAGGMRVRTGFNASRASLRRLWWHFNSVISKGSLRDMGIKGYRELIRHELVEHSIFKAVTRYNPRKLSGMDMKIVTLDPKEGDHGMWEQKLGWDRLVDGDIDVAKLPGTHDTWLLNHADEFGKYLSSILNVE